MLWIEARVTLALIAVVIEAAVRPDLEELPLLGLFIYHRLRKRGSSLWRCARPLASNRRARSVCRLLAPTLSQRF